MVRLGLAAAVLVGMSPGAAAGRAPVHALELYRVKEVGGGLGVSIDQQVIFSAAGGGSEPNTGRWIAERLRHDRNWCGKRSSTGRCQATSTSRHDWMDGAHCPPAYDALNGLAEIPAPTFRQLRRADFTTVDDASLLTIEGLPEQGRSTAQHLLVAEYTGPFRNWWEATERALNSCWTDEAPIVDGVPLSARLGATAAGHRLHPRHVAR